MNNKLSPSLHGTPSKSGAALFRLSQPLALIALLAMVPFEAKGAITQVWEGGATTGGSSPTDYNDNGNWKPAGSNEPDLNDTAVFDNLVSGKPVNRTPIVTKTGWVTDSLYFRNTDWATNGGYTLSGNALTLDSIGTTNDITSGGVPAAIYTLAGTGGNTISAPIIFAPSSVNATQTIFSEGNLLMGGAITATSTGGANGTINKTGVGILTLTGTSSTFGGSLRISAGTVQLGNATTTGSIGNTPIVNNGTLLFNRANALDQGSGFGLISGSGNVSQVGTGGTTTLSNTGNSYSGTTTVSAGTLALGADNVLPNGSAVTLSGGTLATGSFSDSAGAFSLSGSGTKIIDFGTAGTSVLNFSSTTATAWFTGGGLLKIYNWSGIVGATGGTDQLTFTSVTGAGTVFSPSQVQF